MKKAKAVAIIGAPSSGKSTLASQINSTLKTQGENSVYIEEYVTEYIAEYGVPTLMEHQLVIFNEQLKKERMFADKRDFIICDSASFLSYIYGRQYYNYPLTKNNIAVLTYLHKYALESLEFWDYIFYVPILKDYKIDGVRYHNKEESGKIDKMIKGWLELEKVPYIDLSNVKLEERITTVMDYIIN